MSYLVEQSFNCDLLKLSLVTRRFVCFGQTRLRTLAVLSNCVIGVVSILLPLFVRMTNVSMFNLTLILFLVLLLSPTPRDRP